MSKYGQPCTRSAVREYLEAAYLDVDDTRAVQLSDQYSDKIVDGQQWASNAGYVGDQIAEIESLTPNPDFDPDAGWDQ